MAANRLEQNKQAEEPARPAEQSAAAPAKGGNPWIPLIANIILMPAIAYGLTTFVLIPKLQGGKAPAASASKEPAGEAGATGEKGASAKGRITVPLGGKVLVNVAGTAGTRYLVASMTLVGKTSDFRDHVEKNDPQLRDAASSILSAKTMGDLDKPGTRNVVRAELISAFNDILGKEAVIDIYLTEFAIQ